MTGWTLSTDFPIGERVPGDAAGRRASTRCVPASSPTAARCVYSTRLGGIGHRLRAYAVAVGSGRATRPSSAARRRANFPTLNPVQSNLGRGGRRVRDAAVATGNGLVFSTYLGGNGEENPFGASLGVDARPEGQRLRGTVHREHGLPDRALRTWCSSDQRGRSTARSRALHGPRGAAPAAPGPETARRSLPGRQWRDDTAPCRAALLDGRTGLSGSVRRADDHPADGAPGEPRVLRTHLPSSRFAVRSPARTSDSGCSTRSPVPISRRAAVGRSRATDPRRPRGFRRARRGARRSAAASAASTPPSAPLRAQPGQADARAAFVARMPQHALCSRPARRGSRSRRAGARRPHARRRCSPQAVSGRGTRARRPTHSSAAPTRSSGDAASRPSSACARGRASPASTSSTTGRDGELEFDFRSRPAPISGRIEIVVRGQRRPRRSTRAAISRCGSATARSRCARRSSTSSGRAAPANRSTAASSCAARVAVGFRIGAHDPARPLVIDPILSVATYLGGSPTTRAARSPPTPSGAIYVVGETLSLDFPLAGAAPAELRRRRAGRLRREARRERGRSSSTPPTWAARCTTAASRSPSTPTAARSSRVARVRSISRLVAPLQATLGGGGDDAFVAKLAPDGASLDFSTYLGGASNDRGLAIGVDAFGEIALAGITLSADFPTVGAFQPNYGGGGGDGFVAKLRADGRRCSSRRFIGGTNVDNVRALAIDAQRRIAVCGDTNSSDFPVAAAAAGRARRQLRRVGRAGRSRRVWRSRRRPGSVAAATTSRSAATPRPPARSSWRAAPRRWTCRW